MHVCASAPGHIHCDPDTVLLYERRFALRIEIVFILF